MRPTASSNGVRAKPVRMAAAPMPDEEDREHRGPAPAVPEPAGRQRARRKGDEARHGKRKKLAIGTVEHPFESEHHRGVKQKEQVVEPVPDVDEENAGAVRHRVLSRSLGAGGRAASPARGGRGMERVKGIEPSS